MARQAPSRVDLYFEDFLSGMFELTLAERGAYFTVCCLMWKHKGRLPDNDQMIARWCNCSIQAWRSVKAALVANGKIDIVDGFLHQGRAEKVWQEAVERFETAQAKGRKGAEGRARGHENPGSFSGGNPEKKSDLNGPNRLNEKETDPSSACSSGDSPGSSYHQPPPPLPEEDSLTAAAESPTPRARPEDGADAPAAAGLTDPVPVERVDERVIAELHARMAVMGRTIESLRREVELLVASRGSASDVELALRKGLTRANGDPLAYAARIVADENTKRFAAVEAAKFMATAPPGPDPIAEASRLFLETCRAMETPDVLN